MDFRLPPNAVAFAEEARKFVADHVPADTSAKAQESGTMHDWDIHKALATRGWLAPTWPVEEGGQDLSVIEAMVLLDELGRAGVPLDGWMTTMCGASAVRKFGSPAQLAEVVPRVVAGDALIALGFSEPESGSDVAAARTRAVKDGDEWVINGQKMFTTMAHIASWVLLLCRTDPDVPKHRGLSLFLVPLDAPGVEVQPVHTFGGERTNITFYTDVRVPDSARIGELSAGWSILTYALTAERGSAFGAGGLFLGTTRMTIDRATAWASRTERDGELIIDEQAARRRIARAEIDYEVARLLNLRSIGLAASGQSPDIEASMAKLFCTETLQTTTSDLLDLLGAEGLLDHRSPEAPGHGEVEHSFRHGIVTTIYGGSSEVMRNIISQRGLGMPRA